MLTFLNEKREQAEKIYESKKDHYEDRLKTAITESAKVGNRLAVVAIQGYNEPFERYLKEYGLTCVDKNYNYSWVYYTVKW